ncbi:hypothetical protein PanWU01x14_352870 [Parasponia andersonii]|uniref:Uncharacterized protein n=1 Tax=Parasponia andersonii TaxID=3476 RepID=A0A2P5AA78_PARAD|nr:hypothetical protein PanWU01x14_352870 [Parasponia andersonii]
METSLENFRTSAVSEMEMLSTTTEEFLADGKSRDELEWAPSLEPIMVSREGPPLNDERQKVVRGAKLLIVHEDAHAGSKDAIYISW